MSVQFPKGLSIYDIALGLCTVAANKETNETTLNDLRSKLAALNHETVWQGAQEIAHTYCTMLYHEELTMLQVIGLQETCFVYGSSGEHCLCGLWVENQNDWVLIGPPYQAELTMTIKKFHVIRSQKEVTH